MLGGRWTPTLSDEHVAFEWVSAAEASRRLHFPDNRAAVRRLIDRIDPRLNGSRPGLNAPTPPSSFG